MVGFWSSGDLLRHTLDLNGFVSVIAGSTRRFTATHLEAGIQRAVGAISARGKRWRTDGMKNRRCLNDRRSNCRVFARLYPRKHFPRGEGIGRMTEYISREDALAVVCEGCNIDFYKEPCEPSDCRIRGFLRSIPAADVRPVVRAVWRRYSPFTDTYECSNCGEQVIDQQFRTNYCPNCGANMREPSKEET